MVTLLATKALQLQDIASPMLPVVEAFFSTKIVLTSTKGMGERAMLPT
jgi:hypothetical protein